MQPNRVSCERCGATLREDLQRGRQGDEPLLIAGSIIRCSACCYINRIPLGPPPGDGVREVRT